MVRTFSYLLVLSLLAISSDAWAIYTRARFTGPFHFTTCGTLGDANSPAVHMNIRYDQDFAPPESDDLFTLFTYGNPTPAQKTACRAQPLGAACLAAFPENQRAVLPNPREVSFIAHPGLLNAENAFAVLAVSLSVVGGEVQLTHTRVEEIQFHPCPSEIPNIQPGAGYSSPIGSPATAPGTSTDFTNHPVVAHWAGEPMNHAMDTETIVGIVADHPQGINRVEFQLNGGTKVTVTEPSYHPKTAIEGYWVRVNPNSAPPGTRLEFQALAVPNAGRSIVLAGALTPTTSPTGIYSLIHFAAQNLPRPVIYVSQSGNDVTGNGTPTNPVATPGRAVQLLLAQNNNILSLSTIYYDEGEYAFGAGAPSWWNPAFFPYGPLTIAAKPELTNFRKVRFNDIAYNFAPHMGHITRVAFTPETNGAGGVYDHSWPHRATISAHLVDMYGDALLSRHSPVLGGGILYKASRELYSRGGLRGVDGNNSSLWDYHYESAGISFNDTPFVYGGRTENADQSRVDLPGTPPALQNHGDVFHIYGRGQNIYVRELVANVDIAQVQGLFVSTPKVGMVVKDTDIDLTFYEKLPPNIGGPAAPFAGNHTGMFIENSSFRGASNIFGGPAAAPGTRFVVKNTFFSQCPNSRFSEDCNTNTTGAIYLSQMFSLLRGVNTELPREENEVRASPGSPLFLSRSDVRAVLRLWPKELRGLIRKELAPRRPKRDCSKSKKRQPRASQSVREVSLGITIQERVRGKRC